MSSVRIDERHIKKGFFVLACLCCCACALSRLGNPGQITVLQAVTFLTRAVASPLP